MHLSFVLKLIDACSIHRLTFIMNLMNNNSSTFSPAIACQIMVRYSKAFAVHGPEILL